MQVDANMILQFGLKCLGIFALIFLGAVLTPKIAEYIDQWKQEHSEDITIENPQTKEKYTVRSIYGLPSEPEEKEPPRKKAKVRKKSDHR